MDALQADEADERPVRGMVVVLGIVGQRGLERGPVAFADDTVTLCSTVKPGASVVVHSEKDLGAKSRIVVVDSLSGQQP